MPYCARCGVEVDPGTPACPLCDAPIPVFDDDPGGTAEVSDRYPVPEGALDPLSPRQIRMTVWAIVSAVLLIGFVAVAGVDVVDGGSRLTWSGYVLGAIGLAWLLVTSAILFFRRPWLVILADAAPVLGYLAVVDLLDGGLDWLLTLGLPVGSASILVLQVSAILWSVWKDRGSNQVAILVLLLGALCVVIDLVVSAHLGRSSPSWSLVVVAVLVPLAAMLFIHHYVLRRIPKLRRVFHV